MIILNNLDACEKRIRETLHVDVISPSGLRWNQKAAQKVCGKPAGRLMSTGYWQVSMMVNGKLRQFPAHRIIWLLSNGQWPKEDIDHINGNRADNRLINLREASRSENMRNMGMSARNSSGIKGVHFDKTAGKWRAALRHEYKQIYLGYFADLTEAKLAIISAREKIHGVFANHGTHKEIAK